MSVCCTYALPPKASDHHDFVAREVHLPTLMSKRIRVLEVLQKASLPLLKEGMWVAERNAGSRELPWRQNKREMVLGWTSASHHPMKHSYTKTRQRMPASHVAPLKVLLNRHNPRAFCPGLIPCSACTKAKNFIDTERASFSVS